MNRATQLWIYETGGPPLNDPDPELTVAAAMAQQFEGRILLHLRANPRQSRKIYFSRRQFVFNY